MIDISSLQQLGAFTKNLAPTLKAGGIYGLRGDLGVGKTTFVKHIAATLGIEDEVISPTFIYHQTYSLPHPQRGIARLSPNTENRHSELVSESGIRFRKILKRVQSLPRTRFGDDENEVKTSFGDSPIARLHHYDLYRLHSDQDADQLGLEFCDPAGVHFVEWIEHAPALQAQATILFFFEIQPDGRRTVTVEAQ